MLLNAELRRSTSAAPADVSLDLKPRRLRLWSRCPSVLLPFVCWSGCCWCCVIDVEVSAKRCCAADTERSTRSYAVDVDHLHVALLLVLCR